MKCLKTNYLFILICLFISSLTILNAKDFNPIGQIFKDYITDIKNINIKLYENPNIDSVLKDEDYKDSLSFSKPYKIGVPIKINTITKNINKLN